MEKFIIIDGVKYAIDPNDSTKALLDADGKQVLYVEPEADDKNKVDLSKVSLEDLKKANPDVAKALQEMEDLKTKNAKAEADKAEADRKALEDQGKWQDIAKTEETKRKEVEADLTKTKELLEKNQGTISTILDATLKDIPEEKRALIPADYSPRRKLEYITENAKILGVNISPANKGGKIDKNDLDPNLDEESKVRKEYDDLLKKGATRTALESQQMIQLAQKIKEIQNANAKK